MVKLIIIVLFLLFIVSCSNIPIDDPKIDKDKFYKLSMKIDNMGLVQYGIAVLREKPLYTLELTSQGKMDYFSFNACSTNITKSNAGGKIFKRKTTTINYRPNEIEKEKFCDAIIQVTEKLKHRHTSGYVVFQRNRANLKGTMICGSKTKEQEGVSVCQLPEDNFWRIKFSEPTIMASIMCPTVKGKHEEFTLKTELGFCNYAFKGSKEIHRVVTHGYNDEIIE